MKNILILMILAVCLLLSISCGGDDDDSIDDDVDDDAASDDDEADDDTIDDDTIDDDSDDDDDTSSDDDTADDDSVDEFGLTWMEIPAGTYARGCSPKDHLCEADEYPIRDITISSFQMTQTEITQEQYELVMGNHENGNEACVTCPVEYVTWFEAEDYCEAVNGHLPTEAQWEYAARAGTTTRFYCGANEDCLTYIAWYYPESEELSHPVAEKLPNVFGLYDTLGNVWEWVHDWYQPNYYRTSPDIDPPGPTSGMYRILRGGSFYDSDISFLRVSFRPNDEPEIAYGNIGFRCARKINHE